MEQRAEGYLSISRMAELHRISRQTLIYYDKIGLFQPARTGENGYRYYTAAQIPFLREICYLKSIGVPLEEIRRHIAGRSPDTALSLLTAHRQELDRRIEALRQTRDALTRRIEQYESAKAGGGSVLVPELRELEERWVLFHPWQGPPERQTLHLTVMKLWALAARAGRPPSQRFGSLLRLEGVLAGAPLEGAGCFLVLPGPAEGAVALPAGTYACMYKYGMPYEVPYLEHLLSWLRAQGLEPAGDIADACLLDTTFYREDQSVDFCQLQVPVRPSRRA